MSDELDRAREIVAVLLAEPLGWRDPNGDRGASNGPETARGPFDAMQERADRLHEYGEAAQRGSTDG